MPYNEFFSINVHPKELQYSGNQSSYLLSNFTNILYFTLSCRNSPMKFNLSNLALLLEAYSRKYFRFLVNDVRYQLSPRISLFCKSPITIILKFNFSRLSSECIFTFTHVCMGQLDILLFGPPWERSDFLLSFYFLQGCFQPSLFGLYW